MVIGGVFFGSAAWAMYAELVTRVPWQKDQKAFFDMEFQQSKKALAQSQDEWDKDIVPSIKAKLDRKEEIEKSMASGEYAQAKQRLAELDQKFADAELGKTFGASDLDEAYYHRNIAEYERDKLATEVREAYKKAFEAEDPKKGDTLCDAIYADPTAPPQGEVSAKMHHLETEIARMKAHVANIDKALSDAPQGARDVLRKSRAAEQDVVDHLEVEVKHQKRVEEAEKNMAAIDGPPDPIVTEKDPTKLAAEKKRLREEACKDKADTRNCIKWLKIEPVDAEQKALEIDIAKRKRGLVDAQLRFEKADQRANPKFSLKEKELIGSIVGPFQIQQVVNRWMDFERDVDIEAVDRCHTCHMGVDSANYTDASIPREFRTHPKRSQLLAAHPIEKFGCTTCHQGQGRATDKLAHSGWVLEEHHGEERWHFAGDHYWEDPLLQVGALSRVVVDEDNDELAVKIGKGKWETIKIDHRSPELHVKDEETPAEYKTEADLLGNIEEKLSAVVAKTELKDKWHAVVRKIDNRVQIGVEPNDTDARVPAKDMPVVQLKFDKPETAEMLGWVGVAETTAKQPIQVASNPPAVPIRSEGMAHHTKDGKYTPPRGDQGLQVPDEDRNRFIAALPEVESGCFRCHQTDVDLRARGSKAKYIQAKLAFQKAEAEKKKDPEAYKKSHDGSEELPVVPADPGTFEDMAPTFAEGRHLFRQLNCTGCHILDNYPWDRNAGPSLDNLTAKVSPEWILTWIRNPRGWRPKTRMPNLWPRPLDPASKRPVPEGSPEYEKWQAQMREETVAIASFLVEHSDNPASRPGSTETKPLKDAVKGYSDVPDATAERGKLVFESYGCQGCHARSDGDTADEKLPEPWRSRERDHAPTLSNLANKTTADWIAYWVENPSRYWHGTKMPNLRLSRRDAASVGKYLSSLKSTSPNPAQVDKSDVALVGDAAKRSERVPCTQQGGRLMTRVECGEKLIGNYGCFGCHQIAGFEKSAPIAPELGGFAKKDVTTLDFGYAIADHHLQTTETFATLKLDSPRIYRRDRIELKMGDFDLSPREIRALVTFLKGLVPAKPKEEYNPIKHEAYSAALTGRQLVENYNCRGCHVIEDRGGDIDGFRAAQLSADVQARAPWLTAEGQRVQPEWLFNFLRNPGENGIRPWLHPEWAWTNDDVPNEKLALRMPTFNLSNEDITAIVRYFASWDGQEYPYQVAKTRDLSQEEKLYALTHMNSPEAANCPSCHFIGEFPVARGQSELAKMAPNLDNVHKRLRPEWVKEWLLRPGNFLPYTKMTAFWATADRPKDAAMWPAESDPFLSPAPAWNKVPFRPVTGEEQAEIVRDFLFSLKPDSTFPPVGEEATSPLVTGQLVAKAETEADKAKEKDKAAKDKAAKDKAGKKTGAIVGPRVNLAP
jgi:cytochrome c551/c552